MRLRLKCSWILAAIILLTAFASAEPVASLKPSDCVNDFAGVLLAERVVSEAVEPVRRARHRVEPARDATRNEAHAPPDARRITAVP